MITLVGLGPAGSNQLSLAAREALRAANVVFVRTERHPSVAWLRSENIAFRAFDELYETLASFDEVYNEVATQVLASSTLGDVAFAVPGHPLVGERSTRMIIDRAREAGIEVRIASSASFIDPVLDALQVSVLDGLIVLASEALDTLESQPRTGLMVYHIFDPHSASEAKLRLMKQYPDEHPVFVVRHAGDSELETVEEVPLFRLDRGDVDHLVTIYLPPVPEEERRKTFNDLVEVMARLRGPGGCPWDIEQDHVTLKRYLIEECYEALEAIDENDLDALCDELGDILLQVVFHAQLETETGMFDIHDVTQRIVDKLIRRHPHVFGDVEVTGTDDVLTNWEKIKRAEKGDDWRTSILDGVPAGLPALMRATDIGKRVAKVGFEWDKFEDVKDKVHEEFEELEEAIASGDRAAIVSELGDLLFAVTQVARWQKVDPEEALRQMLRRFTARFQYIEGQAKNQDRELMDMSLAEMDALWNQAKTLE